MMDEAFIVDGYKVRKNTDLNTLELVEVYEHQANVMVGSDDTVRQAAANTLFRLRQEMHKKIHELLGKNKCEFCVEELEG